LGGWTWTSLCTDRQDTRWAIWTPRPPFYPMLVLRALVALVAIVAAAAEPSPAERDAAEVLLSVCLARVQGFAFAGPPLLVARTRPTALRAA